MTAYLNTEPSDHSFSIDVAGADLAFRPVALTDRTPTGAQISAAAGFSPAQSVTILHLLPDGAFEDIRPDEVVDLRQKRGRFIVMESDTSYRILVEGKRIDWPSRRISVSVIRQLGNVPADKAIYVERQDEPDELLDESSLVDLAASGVEVFYARSATWILNVQGVRLELHEPLITVSDALVRAGFDPNYGWHIYLKVVGQPKQAMGLTSVVDLRTPGIEKLRLTPKDVSNGEGISVARREFALLEVDEEFLDKRFAHWETLTEGGRQWLLIHAYAIPEGFNHRRVTMALEVPPHYPGAQIDMFYVSPMLIPISGLAPPNTEARVTIQGLEYQRWSRHRGQGSGWNPSTDNVVTHLALVESALLKEMQQ